MTKSDTPPEINYLAKDYATFRRLLLDHLSLWVPGWTEEHPADLGHAIVEVLAYAADNLSYYQDAVATEAYLGTARLRRSVKRHVRLLDYAWHEGCNARVWVHVQVKDGEPVRLPKGTQLFTRLDGGGTNTVIQRDSPAYAEALSRAPAIFETMSYSRLCSAQNKISFFTPAVRTQPGEEERRYRYYCRTAAQQRVWLKRGATQAVLYDRDPPSQVFREDNRASKMDDLVNRLPVHHASPETQMQLSWLFWLQVGHVLMFEEIRNPESGQGEEADPKHRHAVRLTRVTRVPAQLLFTASLKFQKDLKARVFSDAFRQEFEQKGITLSSNDKVTIKEVVEDREWQIRDNNANKVYLVTKNDEGLNISAATIEIEWGADDALPFDLCLSASYDGIETVETSMVLGNIVLADHGRTVKDEELPGAPGAGRYNPHLRHKGLTFSEPFHRGRAAIWSAKKMVSQEPRRAMPCVALRELSLVPLDEDGRSLLPLEEHRGFKCPVKHWVVRSELLESDTSERDYAVEIEEDGRAYLRFGFLGAGWRPEVVGAPFVATYRVGNGSAGNVGRDTLTHIVTDSQEITGVRNPLPAQEGTDPVSTETARRHAPEAYRTSKPCVTESDYVEAAERHPQVARAVAQLRWTGSWRTAFIYVQRPDDRPMDEEFRRELADFMEPFRLAGCELEILGARLVPIEIALKVYLQPRHQTSVVIAALHEAFGARTVPDEKTGFFHPARWAFGQAVYQSQVIARAMAVPGVARVEVNRFRARGADRDADPIPIGPLEIVRLHNDPADPSQGTIEFKLT